MTVTYDSFLQNNVKIALDHSRNLIAETRALNAELVSEISNNLIS